jgi:flavin-dependent dehydrogenase
LNHRAVDALDRSGLGSVLKECDARPIEAIRVVAGGRTATFSLPRGLAIARAAFDQALADEAVRAGATFAAGMKAIVEPGTDEGKRWVGVHCAGRSRLLTARVVLCADGLSRSSVARLPECATRASGNARIGIGTTVEGAGAGWPDESITMVVSREGYVGLARSGPHGLNVAAALEPSFLSRGPIGELLTRLMKENALPAPEGLTSARWYGTPPLSSRPRHVAAERLFLIGDAAGYVEPFTGDGMAAALEGAIEVTPLALEAASNWQPALARQWQAAHCRLVHRRQAACRQLAWILRQPWAVSASLRMCAAYPRFAARWVAKVS